MPTIDIVMCTRNGGRFIDAQMQSFAEQDHRDWRLWVSDDGSSDDTLEKVAAFAAAHPQREVMVFNGPQQGAAANFLSVLGRPELAGAWVAFSDQDDVWFSDKLSRAVSALSATSPAIYAARCTLTDADLVPLSLLPLHLRPYGFGNALVQNVLGGNTIVLPPQVTDLLRASVGAARSAKVAFHDWWMYQMATGAGMPVHFDNTPAVFYRQHAHNVIGAGPGGSNKMARFRMLRSRQYAEWIGKNLTALKELQDLLTPQNASLLNRFDQWRDKGQMVRGAPQSLGLYRQTVAGNLILRGLARSGRL